MVSIMQTYCSVRVMESRKSVAFCVKESVVSSRQCTDLTSITTMAKTKELKFSLILCYLYFGTFLSTWSNNQHSSISFITYWNINRVSSLDSIQAQLLYSSLGFVGFYKFFIYCSSPFLLSCRFQSRTNQ